MNPKRQTQIDEVFLSAMKLAPDEHAAFLAKACEGFDPLIRFEVEQLIDGDRAASAANLTEIPLNLADFLDPTKDTLGHAEDEGRIGNYRLLRKIGEGGMGVVYLADQLQPVRRQVALKVIKPGMDSKHVIARFEAERQALALMDHPNIAKVLDASTTKSGRPYFVMELVQGLPITMHADERRLSLRERLELFILVCQAVQHAHQKGVIHRDLKPSNVLIANYASRAVPKVIDFGIAKATAQSLTDKTLYTQLGQLVGTLEYMSPEQAQVNQVDIDTRTDIYSLGVLLYELLTGSTPLDRERLRSAGFEEILRLIREVEAPRPSIRLSSIRAVSDCSTQRRVESKKMTTLVRGELDWIVMRALEKERMRRYETADAFAADVQRFLDDEPVVACPPSASYRIRKTFKRNRKTVFAVGLVFLSLVVGIIGTSMQWLRSTRLAKELQKSAYVADMKLANQAHNVGDMARVSELLLQHQPELGGPDLRGFEWHYLFGLTREVDRVRVLHGKGAVDRLALVHQKDASRLAIFQNQELSLRQFPFLIKDEQVHRTTASYSNEWYWLPCVAIASHGNRYSTISNVISAQGNVQSVLSVWDTDTGLELDSIDVAKLLDAAPTKDLRGTSIAFSANGNRLVTGHWDGTVAGWTFNAKQELESTFAIRAHDAAVVSVALDAQGESVASASWDHQLRLSPFVIGGAIKSFAHGSRLNDVAISANGRKLYTTTQRGRLYITDAETQEQRIVDEGVILFALAVSPDERLVAVGGEDGMIRIRDASSGELITKLRGHAGGLRELAFSFDGRWLISGGERGQVRLWSMTDDLASRSDAFVPQSGLAPTGPTERILNVSTQETFDLSFHPTRPLLGISADNQLKFWNLTSERFEKPIEMNGRVRSIAFAPDGERVFIGSWATTLHHGTRVFDLSTLTSPSSGIASFDANVAMLGGDGRFLILSRDHQGAKVADISVFDTETNEFRLELKNDDRYQFGYGVDRSAISPDNKTLVAFAHSGDKQTYVAAIRAWDLRTKQELWTIQAHEKPIHSLEFSPDGELLVSTSDDHTIRFWEPRLGGHLRTLKGHRSWVMESAFAPDGQTLATASVDGTVRLWDVTSGTERFVFRGDGSPFICVAISSDGNTIAAGNLHGKVWIWHARSL